MLTAAWAPLASVLVLSFLMRRRRAEARRGREGERIVAYGNTWRILPLVVGAIWTGLFAYLAVTDPPKPDDMPAVYGLIAIATLTVAPVAITVFGASVHVTDKGLRKRSPWTRNFETDWSGIRRILRNRTWNWLVFETDAGTIRVSNYMDGLGDLMSAVERHVPPDRRALA